LTIDSFTTNAAWLATVVMMTSFAIALGISKGVGITLVITYVVMGVFYQLFHQ
jgi:4-hydroxybenzoate polyprenyltransferase